MLPLDVLLRDKIAFPQLQNSSIVCIQTPVRLFRLRIPPDLPEGFADHFVGRCAVKVAGGLVGKQITGLAERHAGYVDKHHNAYVNCPCAKQRDGRINQNASDLGVISKRQADLRKVAAAQN